jgi:hypothetical protein
MERRRRHTTAIQELQRCLLNDELAPIPLPARKVPEELKVVSVADIAFTKWISSQDP